MSRRVAISQWIIQPVGIVIEPLRIIRVGGHRIRTQEPSQLGRVEPCPVVIDAQSGYLSLPGEEPVGQHRGRAEARFAEGVVPYVGVRNGGAGVVCQNTCRAQVIFQYIVDVVAGRRRDGDPHRAPGGVIGLCACDRPAGVLVHFTVLPLAPSGSH